MAPIEKAKWLTDFWAQIAAGKTAQVLTSAGWKDIPINDLVGPHTNSRLESWRIKPEPRRMWSCGVTTFDEKEAATWKEKGLAVTEWLEVV